jgi:hypothetical protein
VWFEVILITTPLHGVRTTLWTLAARICLAHLSNDDSSIAEHEFDSLDKLSVVAKHRNCIIDW